MQRHVSRQYAEHVTWQHADDRMRFCSQAMVDHASASYSCSTESRISKSLGPRQHVLGVCMSWGYTETARFIPVLSVQSKYKAVKFSCKQRAALLTALYQCMTQAAMRGHCTIALKILG